MDTVESQTSDIATAKSDITTLDTDLATAKTTIERQQATIANLASNLADLTALVASIDDACLADGSDRRRLAPCGGAAPIDLDGECVWRWPPKNTLSTNEFEHTIFESRLTTCACTRAALGTGDDPSNEAGSTPASSSSSMIPIIGGTSSSMIPIIGGTVGVAALVVGVVLIRRRRSRPEGAESDATAQQGDMELSYAVKQGARETTAHPMHAK